MFESDKHKGEEVGAGRYRSIIKRIEREERREEEKQAI